MPLGAANVGGQLAQAQLTIIIRHHCGAQPDFVKKGSGYVSSGEADEHLYSAYDIYIQGYVPVAQCRFVARVSCMARGSCCLSDFPPRNSRPHAMAVMCSDIHGVILVTGLTRPLRYRPASSLRDSMPQPRHRVRWLVRIRKSPVRLCLFSAVSSGMRLWRHR